LIVRQTGRLEDKMAIGRVTMFAVCLSAAGQRF
jgi:hypothetical protein